MIERLDSEPRCSLFDLMNSTCAAGLAMQYVVGRLNEYGGCCQTNICNNYGGCMVSHPVFDF